MEPEVAAFALSISPCHNAIPRSFYMPISHSRRPRGVSPYGLSPHCLLSTDSLVPLLPITNNLAAEDTIYEEPMSNENLAARDNSIEEEEGFNDFFNEAYLTPSPRERSSSSADRSRTRAIEPKYRALLEKANPITMEKPAAMEPLEEGAEEQIEDEFLQSCKGQPPPPTCFKHDRPSSSSSEDQGRKLATPKRRRVPSENANPIPKEELPAMEPLEEEQDADEAVQLCQVRPRTPPTPAYSVYEGPSSSDSENQTRKSATPQRHRIPSKNVKFSGDTVVPDVPSLTTSSTPEG